MARINRTATRVVVRGKRGRFERFDGRKKQTITIINKVIGQKVSINSKGLKKHQYKFIVKNKDKFVSKRVTIFGKKIKRERVDKTLFDEVIERYGQRAAIFVLRNLGLI